MQTALTYKQNLFSSYQNAFKMCFEIPLESCKLVSQISPLLRWRVSCLNRLSPWLHTFWSFLYLDIAFLKFEIWRLFHGKCARTFLFSSCDASKERTNERSERVKFLMHHNKWIKIVQALSMVCCFYFICTEMFSFWPRNF